MFDGGYGVTLDDRDRRAAIQHRCGECGRVIEIGEVYRKYAGVWEGDFFTAKTCAHCKVGAAWLIKECSGYMFGAVAEDLREHVLEGAVCGAAGVRVSRYVIGMRRGWKRFDGAGLMAVPV